MRLCFFLSAAPRIMRLCYFFSATSRIVRLCCFCSGVFFVFRFSQSAGELHQLIDVGKVGNEVEFCLEAAGIIQVIADMQHIAHKLKIGIAQLDPAVDNTEDFVAVVEANVGDKNFLRDGGQFNVAFLQVDFQFGIPTQQKLLLSIVFVCLCSDSEGFGFDDFLSVTQV
ncbi:MAG: hypothetical protein BWX77_00770 [Bacteroidetes bacterium ADurb.Bin090]|nr:MAG: hypothetical protein BWX77_00770 [Bacteroidetes bacterium ADurb.Bin090]